MLIISSARADEHVIIVNKFRIFQNLSCVFIFKRENKMPESLFNKFSQFLTTQHDDFECNCDNYNHWKAFLLVVVICLLKKHKIVMKKRKQQRLRPIA